MRGISQKRWKLHHIPRVHRLIMQVLRQLLQCLKAWLLCGDHGARSHRLKGVSAKSRLIFLAPLHERWHLAPQRLPRRQAWASGVVALENLHVQALLMAISIHLSRKSRPLACYLRPPCGKLRAFGLV